MGNCYSHASEEREAWIRSGGRLVEVGKRRFLVHPRPEQMENEESTTGGSPITRGPDSSVGRGSDPSILFKQLTKNCSTSDGIKQVYAYLADGGTDVERVKREYDVSDEILRKYGYPTNLEEYRQRQWRLGSQYISACFSKLNETTHEADDLELLDVLFVHTRMPCAMFRHHMHFRAMHKSKVDPGIESTRLYCAILFVYGGKQCRVVGCVLLEDNCAGGSHAEVGKCLDSHAGKSMDADEARVMKECIDLDRKRQDDMRRTMAAEGRWPGGLWKLTEHPGGVWKLTE